jgi:hypothetical protein
MNYILTMLINFLKNTANQKLIVELILVLARELAKKTKTPVDDAIVAAIAEALNIPQPMVASWTRG